MVNASNRSGVASRLFAATGGALNDALAVAGVCPQVFGVRDPASAATALRMAKAVIAARPDVAHLWDEWTLYNVGPMLALGGIAYICAFRNPPSKLSWARRQVGRVVLARSARIISPSAALKAQALAAFRDLGLAPRWRTIPDAPFAEAQPRERTDVLRELGLPMNARLIGTACRFTTTKSIRDAIFAAALLRMAHQDVRFVFCGDGPAAADIRTFCERMRMPDLTVFPGTRLDAAELIRHFTVYVDAAVVDGPSRGIAEAQRCGIPVVCVDTPIRREQVRPEIDGLFAPPHDPGALTRQIHQLLLDEPLRQRLGAAGRTQFLAGAERNDGAAELLELYRSIANRSLAKCAAASGNL
ncbi:MAG: hypothetical protein C0483_06425 [Pirellula sp.]|nr:hypothetical protein [Pirellula sp.]